MVWILIVRASALRLVAALSVLVMVVQAAAAADRDVLQLAGAVNYSELYLENPKVSGNLVVGVRWASSTGVGRPVVRFDPLNVRMIVPAELYGRSACVDVTSKDGRYTAENLYAVPPDPPRQPKLYTRTKYEDVLHGYVLDSVAVMIRAGSDCNVAQSGTIVPAVLVPQGSDMATEMSRVRSLVVQVNADPDRVRLGLYKSDETNLGNAICISAGEGVLISYSTTCTFEPARLSPGSYRLHFEITERFKIVPANFVLLVAE
jgi:hypothetical protein